MKSFYKMMGLAPLIIFLLLWELFARLDKSAQFLFSSPLCVVSKLIEKISTGELLLHTAITAFEAAIGLALGLLIGSIFGFLLLYYPQVSKISRPYIVALSSIPVFAIAPMMIIWFGTGLVMKIALAFFSTVFVSIFQAYQGGKSVNLIEQKLFEIHGASKRQRFWKMIFPSAIDWIIQSLKLNCGLALLGAFIGEFISSERGLGYIIIKASGLYDVSYVLAATICIITLAFIFNLFIQIVEINKIKIIRKLSGIQKNID